MHKKAICLVLLLLSNGIILGFEELSSGPCILRISDNGQIEMLQLNGDNLIKSAEIPGLFRLHVPLEDFEAQIVEAHLSKPEINASSDAIELQYRNLISARGPIDITVKVSIKSLGDGSFELQCVVNNKTQGRIPQVFFPWFGGIKKLSARDRVMFAKSDFYPWQAWRTVDEVPRFMKSVARPFREQNPLDPFEAGMKWMDYGNDKLGVTLYSKETAAREQYMVVSSEKHGHDSLDMGWYFYPYIESGQTWTSPVFVLYPHTGDWHYGAIKFREYTKTAFKPLETSVELAKTLGVYSIWMSWHYQDWQNVKYRYTDIPKLAKQALDAGFTEMMLARATELDFCLPHVVRTPLGTDEELKAAVLECERMGINARLFVTCRSIRPDTISPRENPDDYWILSVAGQTTGSNWTYDPFMIPSRQIRQIGSRAAYLACAASENWQEAFWKNYDHVANDWAVKGYLFDQSYSCKQLCFNPLHNHKPDEPTICYDNFLRKLSKKLKTDFGDKGVLIAEDQWDGSSQWADYNWGWWGLTGEEDRDAPFCIAFPETKQAYKVANDIFYANRIFASGSMIDVYLEDDPDLSHYPALTDHFKQLAKFKLHFYKFLGDRDEFLHNMYVETDAESILANVHKSGNEALIMLTHKDGQAAKFSTVINTERIIGNGLNICDIYTGGLEKLDTAQGAGKIKLNLELDKNEFLGIHVHAKK